MNDYKDLVIYAADIGSIKANKFGWNCIDMNQVTSFSDSSIINFANHMTDDLSRGKKICVGFECPLFLNLPDDPIELTSARLGEGDRAWSASAGSCALSTGLAEVMWVFNQMASTIEGHVIPTFQFDELIHGNANLYIWEAFVSSTSKGTSHCDDARKAAEEFSKRLYKESLISDVHVIRPYSLAGAALIRSGLTKDVNFISQQCLVVKV